MEDDIPQELTQAELARRLYVDRVWGLRRVYEKEQQQRRLHAWWLRWQDRFDMIWALGVPRTNMAFGPTWKWKRL